MYWRGIHKFKHIELLSGGTLNYNTAGGTNFYVNTTNGSDSSDGKSWGQALLTIQAAIDKCTDFKNDCIFVIREATTDVTNATGTPILMNKHTVHLIGMTNQDSQGALIRLVHYAETDNVMEFPQDTGYHCEVVGFGFGGGTTTKGGIAVTGGGGGGTGTWIHHNNFGSLLTKGTPDYGIFNDGLGAEMQCWTIEDNTFYGSGGLGAGLISVSGINLVHSPGILTASKHLMIRRNVFHCIPSAAINLDGVKAGNILNNTFMMAADTAGIAITIGNDCRGCWIDGNSANFGSANDATGPAWLHNATADYNTWGRNYMGSTITFPAT